MDVSAFFSRLNPLIAWLLRSPFHGLVDSAMLLVTVTGRRSGVRYTIPVGYRRRGDVLDVLVSRAPTKRNRSKRWSSSRAPPPRADPRATRSASCWGCTTSSTPASTPRSRSWTSRRCSAS